MADEIDKAADLEQVFLGIQINRAMTNQGKLYYAIGKCNYCDEPFPSGDQRLFCDGNCATDQDMEDKALERKRGRL